MGIPHFALPLRLDGAGHFAVLEQDTVEEIAQAVAVCITTPVGSRVEVPDYGVARYDFQGIDPGSLVASVAEWEPRADLTVDAVRGLGRGESLEDVRVVVRPSL